MAKATCTPICKGAESSSPEVAARVGATLPPALGPPRCHQEGRDSWGKALVPWRHAGQHGTAPASGQAQWCDRWLGNAGNGMRLLCVGQTPILGFPPRTTRGWGDAWRAGWGSAFGTRHAGEEGTRRPPTRCHCWGRGATPHLGALSSTVPIPTAPTTSVCAGPSPSCALQGPAPHLGTTPHPHLSLPVTRASPSWPKQAFVGVPRSLSGLPSPEHLPAAPHHLGQP